MASAAPTRMTTIRRSLFSSLVALVVLTGGVILLASWVAGERTVEDLSKLLIEPTIDRVSSELDEFFGAVRREVMIGREWADSATFDAADHEALNTLFVPILEQHPQISSMMVATSEGVEFLLLRDALHPTIWHNRIVKADEWGPRVFNRRWDTETGEVEESFGELDYDPRRRIWYTEALKTTREEPVFWTEPVIFFITKDPGITASTHFEIGDGTGRTIVVAFDLLLLDISRFTSQLRVSENGRAFVLVERPDGEELQVVGLPRDERFPNDASLKNTLMFVPPSDAVVDSQARLPTLGELEVSAVETSTKAWQQQRRPGKPFGFSSDGASWLGGMQPYPVGHNTFWIGVVLPEKDLLGGVALQQYVLLGVVVVVLLLGMGRAALLARRFSEPIESLVGASQRMAEGDLEPGDPIRSNVREFQHLAEAQDDMREGLRARMKLEKIERDLDLAREIQHGLLPSEVPVADGLEVAGWNLPADQTGGDFYDWLELPDGRLVFTLADVTGHGIGPALIVAVYRAYLRASTTSGDERLSGALQRINDLLFADIPADRFVTAVVGVIDTQSMSGNMLSAGHAPLLYYEAATGEVLNWDADEVPLGIMDGVQFGSPRKLEFKPGDMLLLVTDGFFEWANPEGEQFGTARLVDFTVRNAGLDVDEFIQRLYAEVRQHVGETPQGDDLTAVVIRRNREAAGGVQAGS